jgi:gamma-butyrobetaine dioxygenase
MADLTITTFTDAVLTLAVDGEPFDLHAIWLRDACTCSDCRRPSTNERLLDSTTIPLDLTVDSVDHDGEHLVVETSDGHRCLLDPDAVVDHVRAGRRVGQPAGDLELWDGISGLPVATFARSELHTLSRLAACLEAVLRRGVALVREVETDELGLREIAALIGEIRATNYGVTWEIEAQLDPVSAVDSERHLLVHTDLPYRDVAPGVQLLLSVVADVAGGVTTLVDGYAVAESIRHRDPDAWRLLTEIEFTYPYVRDNVEFHGRAPLIGLHHDGTYHQIRRAPDLVGVPFVSAADTPALYRALRTWTAAVDDPANEIQIALTPGDLVIFHNHRLLHGRTAFALGAHGRRHLVGCYVDIEDVRSRRAVLARET